MFLLPISSILLGFFAAKSLRLSFHRVSQGPPSSKWTKCIGHWGCEMPRKITSCVCLAAAFFLFPRGACPRGVNDRRRVLQGFEIGRLAFFGSCFLILFAMIVCWISRLRLFFHERFDASCFGFLPFGLFLVAILSARLICLMLFYRDRFVFILGYF